MKSIISITALTLLSLLPVTFVQAQETPKAASEKRSTIAGAGKRTDVYHVHFTKAALGKAVQLGDWLKTPNPNDPMPGHFIVLRHQDGDAWDYVVIRGCRHGRACGQTRLERVAHRYLCQWSFMGRIQPRHGYRRRLNIQNCGFGLLRVILSPGSWSPRGIRKDVERNTERDR